MRLNRLPALTVTAAAVGAILSGSVLAQTAPTAPTAPAAPAAPAAATPPAEPAPPTITVPRRYGVFSGGPITEMTYTPQCGTFEIGIDAEAIQNATSRTFLLEQQAKFDALQGRWDAWTDCVIVNAQEDYNLMNPMMSAAVSARINEVASGVNAVVASIEPNVARVSAIRPPPPPRQRRGQQPAAEAVPAAQPPGVPPVTYTAPEGRFPGVFSAGPSNTVTYSSACPAWQLEVTVDDFNTVTDRAALSAMIEIVRSSGDRFGMYRTCLLEQANEDLDSLDDVINGGANQILGAAGEAYGMERNAIQRQLNLHKEPGGLLAAPESRPPAARTPARPASPPAAPRRRPG